MYNVVSGARGRERDLEETRGSKRMQEDARGARGSKRSQEEPEGQEEAEDSEEPEGAEGVEYSEYSEYSELADTACRVPTTLSLTNSFPLSVQRSTLNAQR